MASDGLAELFAEAGVRVVTCGPDGVTEDDILDEILASAAHEVAVLPNDADLIPVASRAATRARELGREVGVVPTRAPVQGLAACAVGDPGRRFGDDVIAMAEAAAATRWAEVTVAEQEALTSAGRCQPGDALGSAEGDVAAHRPGPRRGGPGPARPAAVRRRGDGHARRGRDEDWATRSAAHLSSRHPTIEVVRYGGGPAGIPLQVGVE